MSETGLTDTTELVIEIGTHRVALEREDYVNALIDNEVCKPEEADQFLEDHRLDAWDDPEWMLKNEAVGVDGIGEILIKFPTLLDWDAYEEIVTERLIIIEIEGGVVLTFR